MGKLNISIFKFHLNVEFFCELGLCSTLWSGFAIRSDLQLFKLSLSKFDLTTKDRMHLIFQKQTAVSWVEQIQRSTFVWYMSQINKCTYVRVFSQNPDIYYTVASASAETDSIFTRRFKLLLTQWLKLSPSGHIL